MLMRFLALVAVLSLVSCASSPRSGSPQSSPPTPPASAADKRAPTRGGDSNAPANDPATTGQESSSPKPDQAAGRAPDRREEPQIKPYEKVITKEAKSDDGLFKIHRIKEKVYYEIPKALIGRELLWVSQVAQTTLGVGYGGQPAGNRVVRWDRYGDRVLLRNVSYDVVADSSHPISRAVQAANFESVIMAFNIEAMGQDDAPVIEVSKLFNTEVPELSVRARVQARSFDNARAFIERVVAFPENIEVEAIHTFVNPPDPPSSSSPGPRPQAPPRRPGASSVLMHYSMVLLPEQPMMPRLCDERVGYFSVRLYDYGQDEHRAPRRCYVTRWRLEKQDPAASVSAPVEPIVFYVDPATPSQWVPYVKSGVEKWRPAFEAAGFRDAIVAKEAPSSADDSDWSPEDARYSVIRWLPSTVANASGPHIHDPRSGEILEADIQMHHNVMSLVRDWYFVQVAPLNPRAQRLPLPDDLMGQLIEYVVAHEVGHTLGFQHNMKASSLYPFEKVRDPEWIKTMSHTPTLMDYARFNYVAQPEDGIEPVDLIPKIGPYDVWATVWGYRPIPGVKTPDEEKPTLDEWARQQDQTPHFRFSTEGASGADPGELTEAVGDADAMEATRLGLKNLERVATLLLPATTTRPGEPYDDLKEVYGRLLGQWATELTHVTAVVGGFDSQQKHAGQDGVRFTPVPRDRQIAAVAFLNERAFTTPPFLVAPDVLGRIGPTGGLTGVVTAQRRVLTSLLSTARLNRLVEQQAIGGSSAYRPSAFLADVRGGLWGELEQPRVTIDPFRRNLQRAYLELLGDRINGRQANADEARALFRLELRTLDEQIQRASARAADAETQAHLADTQAQIARALDPSFQTAPAPRPGSSPLPTIDPNALSDDEAAVGCWPDYAVHLGSP
ncbi:MAG: DUF5117 domain-containing protein [Luteitalea sp.]|nr:DUF5117 domain-containing protein [Luteitalea sp.]